MSELAFERVTMTDEEGFEVEVWSATLGNRVTYGRNRAGCLEEMAYELRRTEHEQVFHGYNGGERE